MASNQSFLVVPDDWQERVARAAVLTSKGIACVMCGGTGGWPGLHGFVHCRLCCGDGKA